MAIGSFDLIMKALDTVIYRQFEIEGVVKTRAIIMTDDGPVDHPLNWVDETDKQLALIHLQRRIAELGASRYALLGEAWMAPWSDHGDLLPAAKSDQRIEIVYFHLRDTSGVSLLGYRPIETTGSQAALKRNLGALRVETDIEGDFSALGLDAR